MEEEFTLGDIYEDIAERLAAARTKALLGEREEALGVFRGAALDYRRFREVLAGYPGCHALEHAFNATLTSLEDEHALAQSDTESARPARASRPRKKVRQVA